MKKLLLSLTTAFMSFAAMAQHTNVTQMQRMRSALGQTAAAERIVAPGIKTANQVSYLKRSCLFDANDGQANAYSFMVFDYRLRTPSVVYFTTEGPRDYKMMVDYAQVPGKSIGLYASSFIGDKILAYAYLHYGSGATGPYGWVSVDPMTGKYEVVKKVSSNSAITMSDMTYDPETKLMYALQEIYNENTFIGTQVYTIDPADPNLKIQKAVMLEGKQVFTIAADKGNLYCVASIWKADGSDIENSYLIKMTAKSVKQGKADVQEINKQNGFGIPIHWSQSMEFDKINHRLWWIAQASDDSYFCEIDTEKGTLISKDHFDYVAQSVAFTMPYQDVNPTAPSYVRSLNAAAADKGEGTVSFSWTNPSVDFYLEPLKSLTNIKIIRDGEVVGTIAASGIGQAQTYEDKNVPSGNHIYKVQTVNENGDGSYKEFQMFVGHDVPAGVSGVKVVTDGCNATISWHAPSMGINGGWIDKTSLKYDVVRYPDSVKIASDITECKVNDAITKTEGYVYAITAKNADGVGATTKSEVTVFGPTQGVPFFTKLNSENDFNKWSVIDNNHDMITWKFSKTENAPIYERAEGPANDYFVTPKITFEDGKKYQIRFKYWTMNWVEPSDGSPIYEKMDVYYAQEPTDAAFQKEGKILDLGKFHTPSETYLYAKQVFTAKPGDGYLAFRAYSDANRSIIYLQDVCIREFSATDLSITDLKGSISAVQGAASAYAVEVMNEGSATVDNYTVDIINAETGEVLASADGVAVNSDEKKVVTVEWTPENVGEMKITARVNLKGDTYIDDNVWAEPIILEVAPSGSSNWLSLNKDDAKYISDVDYINMGTAVPFNFAKAYSMAQCIYLDKEITKKNINITGIQFVYDGRNEGSFEKSIKISAMAADKDFFEFDPSIVGPKAYDYDDTNWITLYNGLFKFSGINKDQKLTIEFEQPYFYEGGNLVFMYEKEWDEDYFLNNDAPAFHYHDLYDDGDELGMRSCVYASKTSDAPEIKKIGSKKFIPFTMLQYKDGNDSGIMGITADGLNFDICGGTITMSEVCSSIVIYDIDGKMIAKANNTNKIAINNGMYIIKAVAGSKSIECKVNIK